MSKSKFTVSVAVTLVHPEGARITKSAVKRRVKHLLEKDAEGQNEDFDLEKATVRDVDFD